MKAWLLKINLAMQAYSSNFPDNRKRGIVEPLREFGFVLF
jgi:hypothetical protein